MTIVLIISSSYSLLQLAVGQRWPTADTTEELDEVIVDEDTVALDQFNADLSLVLDPDG